MNIYIVTAGVKGINGQQKVRAPDLITAAQICDFANVDVKSVVFMSVEIEDQGLI